MGLLSKKPKVGIEKFCQQFYDSQVFRAIVGGIDVVPLFWDTAFNRIVEADQSFASIDQELFRKEMTAIRLELFGLAWMHKFKKEELTIPQSVFTKRYLEENGKLEIWDVMGEYNQAIAQSATLTETGEQMEGRIGRARIAYINEGRWKFFYKWAEANLPEESARTKEDEDLAKCIARVANRFGAEVRRNDCILVKRLTARVADRLGCDINLNSEALVRLGAFIWGFYNGAKEYLKSVELQS